MEDRRKSYYVWVGQPCAIWVSFCPIPVAELHEILVPSEWKMEPDPKEGIILRHQYGGTITAFKAYESAKRGKYGFGLKAREA